jgi:SAM-dependent methyltransferase
MSAAAPLRLTSAFPPNMDARAKKFMIKLISVPASVAGRVYSARQRQRQSYLSAAACRWSVDCVIRASHVLEHFPHGQIADVLKEWVRVLKPGGELRIAVPNFEWIAENYVAGQPINTQGYVMGGQIDEADFHKAIFDKRSLTRQLAGAGLMLIREWKSELQDCAALPVSLNLCGTKPHQSEISVSAVMSMPRLAFTDNMFSASRRCRRSASSCVSIPAPTGASASSA